MGESTCLLRSFSNPPDTSSCMAREGDPIRLFGESISFGRYMSESLDWQKWSVFSHNRYVEEAEKFSKPGSVAEKKAYFEAHYKKKAAQKAAALVHQANASVNETYDSETRDENCNNSSIEINSEEKSNVTAIEQHQKDAVSYQVVDYADTNKDKHDIEQSEVEISKVELPEEVPQPLVDNLTVENFVIVDNSNQSDDVEKIAVPKKERMPDPENPAQVKVREVNSSPKLPAKATVSKPLYSLGERKAPVQARSGISSFPKSKKAVGGLAENERPSAKSLHMSINISSRAVETGRAASLLQQNRMKKINFNYPNISRDHPVASSQTLIRASNDVFNQASANPQSEGRRCPISPSTRSPQPCTISSPFRFRSEERAAKRKEFFQRMDEIKSKEAERMQLQRRCKEKTEHVHKKLQQSIGFKPKQNEDKNGGLQLPSNEMRKTSLAQPQSPKSGRKATSSTCHGKNSRNSWKPLISISTSKRVTEKMSRTRGSVTSLSKKVTQENAPPNIQR